jgi:3-dehydroquinate synthase
MISRVQDYDKSVVVIGERLKNVGSYIPDNTSSIVLITDVNVERIYGSEFPYYPVITIQTGEIIKTRATVDFIVEELLKLEADRHTFIVGIGGGIVCDITGYVASVFMRGLDFGYVSTTVLSQVDASIGGKTGINFNRYKNIMGVFSHPRFVICDVDLLKSLPKEEVKSGVIEIVKHAIISDPDLFDYIQVNLKNILKVNLPTLKYLITKSVKIKVGIVSKDVRENGIRKKLNLGHTIGHAIESIEGISHGSAVAIGLVLAAKVSMKLGFCSPESVNQIIQLIESFDMATYTNIETKLLIKAIKKDKKKNLNKVDFILIKEIGEVVIHPISFRELERIMNLIEREFAEKEMLLLGSDKHKS